MNSSLLIELLKMQNAIVIRVRTNSSSISTSSMPASFQYEEDDKAEIDNDDFSEDEVDDIYPEEKSNEEDEEEEQRNIDEGDLMARYNRVKVIEGNAMFDIDFEHPNFQVGSKFSIVKTSILDEIRVTSM